MRLLSAICLSTLACVLLSCSPALAVPADTVVPEPVSTSLFLAGGAVLMLSSKLRKKRQNKA